MTQVKLLSFYIIRPSRLLRYVRRAIGSQNGLKPCPDLQCKLTTKFKGLLLSLVTMITSGCHPSLIPPILKASSLKILVGWMGMCIMVMCEVMI